VFKIEQTMIFILYSDTVPATDRSIDLLTAQLDGDDGLFVTFSDGTTAGYAVEELLHLRPHREPTPLIRHQSSADSIRPMFS
jgi:hypothetical protein